MTENGEPKNNQEEISLYEKIIARTEELLQSGKKSLDEAIKKAGEEMSSAGQFTREQAEKISSFVKRDIEHTVDSATKAKESFKEAVDPQRVAAGAQSIFARILSSTAETLSELAARSERQLTFKTGEVTSPGTLTCKNCGEEIHMKKTTRIPPCPRCHQTQFRKSY